MVGPDGGSGTFIARLEGTDETLVQGTRQPLVDGARVLLGRDFEPATLLTMRHTGKAFDSFRPLTIGQWARWTYKEPDQRHLRRTRWMPFADIRLGQKSGSEPSVTPEAHLEGNRFYGDPGCIGDAHGGQA
jgi:hypothetical protein